MERLGVEREGRLRTVLRRAVHARAEPHGDRSMTTPRDYPKIVTPPPGPKARAIVERQDRWSSTSYPKEYPLAVARGAGPMVEDVDGNLFLGFMAVRGRAVSRTLVSEGVPARGRPRRGTDGRRCRRQSLPRLHGWDRRRVDRLRPSQGREGGAGRCSPVPAHLRLGFLLRELCRAVRATGAPRA